MWWAALLNAINNGEQLWVEQTVSAWQAALNYLVPFCVSSYSAARNEAQQMQLHGKTWAGSD